jgi:hypothetical protein
MARVKRGVTAGRRHKKVLARPRATTTRGARSTAPPSRPSSRPASMRTATGAPRSASSARCGSRASTPRRACTSCRTAADRRPAQGGHRDRSQAAGRPRDPRRERLWRDRRAGQGRAGGLSRSTWRSACTDLCASAGADRRLRARLPKLDELRVHWLGKKGVLTEQLKALGGAAGRRASGCRRAHQHRKGRAAAAIDARRTCSSRPRSRRSWQPAASTSRCPGAANPPAGCTRSRARACASRSSSARRLRCRRRPRGRGRLPQFRGAQYSRGSSGAGDARHLLPRGRQAAAHAHLAGADPRDAVDASRRSR